MLVYINFNKSKAEIGHSINSNLLIKGKIIPRDLNKASELLSMPNITTNDKGLFYLQGLISYKQNKFSKAAKYFEKGSKIGEPACVYKYGKMLFTGEGTKRNNNEAIRYFINSKDQGYEKSGYFLTSFNELNNINAFQKLQPETQMIFIMNNIKNTEIERATHTTQESQFDQNVLQPKKKQKNFFSTNH